MERPARAWPDPALGPTPGAAPIHFRGGPTDGIAAPMIDTLLWDHDGVLVDTERLYFQATREVLSTVGVTLTEDAYRALFLVENSGAWHLARGLGEAEVAALRRQRDDRYAELLAQGDLMIPGALQTVQRLGAHFRMAIVTSSKRAHFDVIHRRTGLPAHFAFVLAREDYRLSKPDPEPYLTAMRRFGAAPSACLVIEDSRRGLLAAKAAGLACWVVPSALTNASSFAEADRRLDTLEALAEALLSSRTR
jgi:HAD superfamily hydrolase (TIGR01509 family)